MKTAIFPIFLVLILISACTTTYNSYNYSDPNYLTADEFQETIIYEKNVSVFEEEIDKDSSISEEGNIVNNYYGDYYEDESQYDFYYSSRIRRFHRPYYNYGYYGNYYTNSYWYTGNPYHCGTSIYYTYGWSSPYHYDYWGYGYYNPFYYSYYTPYYYGGYYNNHYHGHGYYNWGNTYNTSSTSTDYVFGHRGSFSGGNRHQTVKINSNNLSQLNNPNTNIIKNDTKRNISNSGNIDKTIPTKVNPKNNTIKTNNITNEKSNKNNVTKNNINRNKSKSNNSTKTNRNYNNSKRNNSSNKSYNKSGGNNNSRGNNTRGGNRSVKPRK